jgi:Family of unknown function (DUF6412)
MLRTPVVRTLVWTQIVTRTLLRPVALLLFLAAEAVLVVLANTGGLPVGVAFAATAAAGAALVLCAVLAAHPPAAPPTRVRTALRDRERRTAFLPQRDPDAAGRPRPRAPGRSLPTAV